MLLDDHGRFDNSLRSGGERGNGRVPEGHRPAVRHSNGDSKKAEEEFWLWALGGTVAAVGLVGVGWMAIDNMNKQRLAQQQMVAAAQQNSVQQQREKEMHDAQPQVQQPVSEPVVNTGDYYTDANAAAAQSTVAVDVAVAPEPTKELEEEDPDSIISTYAPRF